MKSLEFAKIRTRKRIEIVEKNYFKCLTIHGSRFTIHDNRRNVLREEELIEQVVQEVIEKLKNSSQGSTMEIPVGVSNRHIHVTQDTLEQLFGKGYQLTKLRDLSQPGQFASQEIVALSGHKGVIEKVRILGPARKTDQVEISRTDTFILGIKDVPVRDSGDTKGTPGAAVIGPKGAVNLSEGVIIAKRHIHMSVEEAEKFQVKDKDIVKVKTKGPRSVWFHEVLVRVSENYALDFHLDTDEANAADVSTGQKVELMK